MLAPRKAYLANQLNIRVGDRLLAWLVATSATANMPPSTYVRKVLEDAARRDLLAKGGDDEAA